MTSEASADSIETLIGQPLQNIYNNGLVVQVGWQEKSVGTQKKMKSTKHNVDEGFSFNLVDVKYN